MEVALSHLVRNQVEAAHTRSDLLECRCVLMEQWTEFLSVCQKPQILPVRGLPTDLAVFLCSSHA